MFRSNSCKFGTIILTISIGLFLIVGCSGSAEQQKLSALIQEFSLVVEAYADAVEGADENKKSELDAKVKNLMTVWSSTKSEMIDNITPQVLDQLDNEYQQLAKKYEDLSNKS